MTNKNKCFITLLSTENYLTAVIALKKSMDEVKTSYPLICAVTEDIFVKEVVDKLKRYDIYPIKIKRLQYSEGTRNKSKDHPVLNTASKISLFSLKEYDKLCYIDADTFLWQNIDNVFDWPDGSMIEPSPGEEDDNYGFTGLFVFQPKYHRADFYSKLITECEGADGDILGSLWFHTRTSHSHRIPYRYCVHYSYTRHTDKEFPKVIHFCNREKPWLPEYRDIFDKEDDPYIQKYRQYLSEIYEDDNRLPEKETDSEKGFITLVSTQNYLKGAMVLNRSFKEAHSKYPFIVALTENLYKKEIVDILEKDGIIVEKIEKLEYTDFVKNRWKDRDKYVLNTASKYSLFDLKKYKKLCYIDADTIVMENVDELLDYPDGSMIFNKNAKENEEKKGFSALFVFKPENHIADYYRALNEKFNEVDGTIFANLWFHIMDSPAHQIPIDYCMGYSPKRGYDKFPYKVAHFYGYDKPWIVKDYFENNTPVSRLYISLLNNIEKEYPELSEFN